MVNWTAVGAVAGIVTVVEAPVFLVVGSGYRWVKKVNKRLARIEARSHERRRDDPS